MTKSDWADLERRQRVRHHVSLGIKSTESMQDPLLSSRYAKEYGRDPHTLRPLDGSDIPSGGTTDPKTILKIFAWLGGFAAMLTVIAWLAENTEAFGYVSEPTFKVTQGTLDLRSGPGFDRPVATREPVGAGKCIWRLQELEDDWIKVRHPTRTQGWQTFYTHVGAPGLRLDFSPSNCPERGARLKDSDGYEPDIMHQSRRDRARQ